MKKKKLTSSSGAPVDDNQNIMTAGKKRPDFITIVCVIIDKLFVTWICKLFFK